MRNAVTVQVPGAAVGETFEGEEPTQSMAVAGSVDSLPRQHAVDVPQQHDIDEPEDAGRRPSLFRKVGRRSVVLPLACVAALFVGFGAVSAVLQLGDRPAKRDVRTPPTTAAADVPPPPAPPAVSTPRAPAPGAPAVENQPLPPPPPPPPDPAATSEPASPASPTSAPPTTTAPTTSTPSTTTPSPGNPSP